MKRYAVLLVFVLASMCQGQSVTLPKEVKGEPGSFVRVAAETDGAHVRWLSLDPGLSVFPSDLLKDSKTTVVVAQKAGRYRIAAWTAKGDTPSEAAIAVVIIGEPGPDPGPGPKPPDPTDPLTKSLQTAFDRETDPNKAELRRAFAAVYKEAANVADAAEIKTWGNYFAVIGTMHDKLGTRGKLPVLQTAVGEFLKERFPTDGTKTMTKDDRVLATQTFGKLAGALEGVK